MKLFGNIRFNAEAAMILKERFDYDWHKFTKDQKALFKMMSSEVRANNGNENDLAVYFMVTMVRSVNDTSAHGKTLKKWIHAAAELIPYMNIEKNKEDTMSVLRQINKEVK